MSRGARHPKPETATPEREFSRTGARRKFGAGLGFRV